MLHNTIAKTGNYIKLDIQISQREYKNYNTVATSTSH